MSNPEAMQFLSDSLHVDADRPGAREEFEALLADWPRDWAPLTEEQIADIRRALA